MKSHLDPRLYAIVDVSPAGPAVSLELIDQALGAGVTLVQVRGKSCHPRRLWLAARAIGGVCRRRGVTLIVNDRPDVAAAAAADGVHLGQSDTPPEIVRRVFPALIIGLSVHNQVELRAALAAGAHYVAAGSLYPTDSKGDAKPLDHELFREMAAASSRPLVGIGGITAERASDVAKLGAAGVAVISGLWQAVDVVAAAAAYRRAFP